MKRNPVRASQGKYVELFCDCSTRHTMAPKAAGGGVPTSMQRDERRSRSVNIYQPDNKCKLDMNNGWIMGEALRC